MRTLFLCALLMAACDCDCLDGQCAPCDDAGCDDDAGTDTDTDTDTDTEEAVCDWNTGQHCACDILGELCEDDETVCSRLDGDDGDDGVCIYYTQSDECPDSPWGESTIIINMGGGAQCWLSCEDDDDCPLDQSCLDDPSICYPAE